MAKIKVFLSDPQVIFREGVHFTLSNEDDIEIIGEDTGSESALAAIEANPPNVVIMNIMNGELSGPQATRRIKKNLPFVSVILVGEDVSEEQSFSAIKSGASAYLNKNIDTDNLVTVIREVATGGRPITELILKPRLASMVLAEFKALSTVIEPVRQVLTYLSPKETEILDLIAEGAPISEVAAKLDISQETVKNRLGMVVSKLAANDISKSMVDALQKNLPAIFLTMITDRLEAERKARDELIELRDSLVKSLQNLIGELESLTKLAQTKKERLSKYDNPA